MLTPICAGVPRSTHRPDRHPIWPNDPQMNLLLHGLDYPNIGDGNFLAVNIKEIGDKDRVDIILTNPPESSKGHPRRRPFCCDFRQAPATDSSRVLLVLPPS